MTRQPDYHAILHQVELLLVDMRKAGDNSLATFHDHFDALLLTHGVLHLLGYDHAEPEEHAIMFGIQGDILLGFYAAEAKG